MKKKKQLTIVFVEHKTAERLVLSYFRIEHPRLSKKRLLNVKTDFRVFLSETIDNARVSDMLKVVKKNKMWGYCKHFKDSTQKEVHYWLDKPPLDSIKVFELFAHEIIHAFGYSCEKRAQKMGSAAAFTYKIFKEGIEKKC